MSVTVFVPKLAGDSSGAIVAEWYAEDGATVSAGQPIFRLERDFIAFDVEAEHDGVLFHRANPGDFFFAGAIVAAIEPTKHAKAPVNDSPAISALREAVAEDVAEDEEPLLVPIAFPTVASKDVDEAEANPFSWNFDDAPEEDSFAETPAATDEADPVEFEAPSTETDEDVPVNPFSWNFDDPAEQEDTFADAPVAEVPAAAIEAEPLALDEPADEEPEADDQEFKWGFDELTAEEAHEEVEAPLALDGAAEPESLETDAAADQDGPTEPAPLARFEGSLWHDAIEASRDSESEGAWGAFGDGFGRDDADDYDSHESTTDETVNDRYEPAARFDESPAQQSQVPSDSDDWDDESYEDGSTSLFDAPPAGGTFAWSEVDDVEESAVETPFEASVEAADEAAPDPYESVFETDTPVGQPSVPEQDEDVTAAFATPFEDVSPPEPSVDSYEAPAPEEFAPVAEPVFEAPVEVPTFEEEVEAEPFYAEPAAASLMRIAIDIEVAKDYVGATSTFTAAIAAAIELAVSETWAEYEPTIALVDEATRSQPGPEDVVLFDFASLGIERADAPLNGDAPVAFAIGKTTDFASFDGEANSVSHRASLSMSYDATRLGEFEAARFLATVRRVVETPGDSAAA